MTKPYIESMIVSGMAHNTGNLVVAGIRNLNEYIEDVGEISGKVVDKKWILENIERIKNPLAQLNEDYLKLRDFRGVGDHSRFDRIKIGKIVDDVVHLVKGKALKAKIKLEKSILDNPEIECNINYLQHALLNLVINAIEELKSGGKIRIQTEIDQHKNRLLIKVIDNGIGFQSKDKAKIFEPYYTTKTSGSGLGIPITQFIIKEIHGGDIDATSEFRKGAIFTIELPLNLKTRKL